MNQATKQHILQAALLLGSAYVLARVLHWTGPGADVEFIPELLWPGIVVISLWGLWRVVGRHSS